MKKYLSVYSLFLMLILTSCIEYNEKMKLNDDGSGEITFAVGLSEKILDLNEGEIRSNDFNEEKIKNSYEGKDGIKVLDSRSYSKDGNKWIQISLAFDSLEDLQNASKDSSNNGMMGKILMSQDESGHWIFTRTISNGGDKEDKDSQNMMDMMFSKYEWKYELVLPSKIISTNADEENVDTATNTVKWTFNLASLSSDAVMTVIFEKHETTNNTAYVIIGAVLLIGLAAAALNLSKKKKPESDK